MIAALELSGVVGDAFFLALTIAFFALAVALVHGCRRIVGDHPTEVTR